MFHERKGVGNQKVVRTGRDLSATSGTEGRNKRGRKTWAKETYTYRPMISERTKKLAEKRRQKNHGLETCRSVGEIIRLRGELME